MVIGGSINGNMAVLHEMMLNHSNMIGSHLANVVSAVISDDGLFMSGAWVQHDTVSERESPSPTSLMNGMYVRQHLLRIPSIDEQDLLLDPSREDEHLDHHYPFRVLCSGMFRAKRI